jgi:hypothetical protein
VKTRKEKAGVPSDFEIGICFQTLFAPSMVITVFSTLSKLVIFIRHLQGGKYTITAEKSTSTDDSDSPGACGRRIDEQDPVVKFSFRNTA